MDYRTVTDSAGITATYVPIENVPVNSEVVGGWRPYPVVRQIDQDGDRYRLVLMDGGKNVFGEWQRRGTEVPIIFPSDYKPSVAR